MPFGGGQRLCIGHKFAQQLVRWGFRAIRPLGAACAAQDQAFPTMPTYNKQHRVLCRPSWCWSSCTSATRLSWNREWHHSGSPLESAWRQWMACAFACTGDWHQQPRQWPRANLLPLARAKFMQEFQSARCVSQQPAVRLHIPAYVCSIMQHILCFEPASVPATGDAATLVQNCRGWRSWRIGARAGLPLLRQRSCVLGHALPQVALSCKHTQQAAGMSPLHGSKCEVMACRSILHLHAPITSFSITTKSCSVMPERDFPSSATPAAPSVASPKSTEKSSMVCAAVLVKVR